jgi:hypothetical protein
MSHPPQDRIRALSEGSLPEAQAAPLRAHLLACRPCRDLLAGERPEALFALLGGERPAPVDWESFGRRLRASIEEETFRGTLVAFPARRWARAAALAAAALLLALLALLPLGRGEAPAPSGEARIASAATLEASPAAEPLPEDLVRILDEALRRHRALDPLGEPPVVELVESSTAQVIDLGTSGSGMQVVLIVDEEIDL